MPYQKATMLPRNSAFLNTALISSSREYWEVTARTFKSVYVLLKVSSRSYSFQENKKKTICVSLRSIHFLLKLEYNAFHLMKSFLTFSQHVALLEKHEVRTTCHRSLITKPRNMSQNLYVLQFMCLSKRVSREKLIQQKNKIKSSYWETIKPPSPISPSSYHPPRSKGFCQKELVQIQYSN